MKLGKAEDVLEQLSVVEPVYHRDYGDACRLHLKNGEVLLDKRSIRGVKQGLVKIKALDSVRLRQICGLELGRDLNLPVPLSAGLVLVPLKMREPITGNDLAYGLINLFAIKKVKALEGGALIVVDEDRSIRVLTSRDKVLAHLAEGILMHRYFVEKVWGNLYRF